MLLDKPYIANKPHIKVNLQLFAKTVKNKAEGLSKEDLEELKNSLGDDDSDDDDSDQDDDDSDDDADEKEEVDEDPENESEDDDNKEDNDDSDDDSEDDPDEDDASDDDEQQVKSKGKSKTQKPDSKGEGKDKKTGAIIALKHENQDLKARLDALEKNQRDRDYDNEIDTLTAKYADELIEDGMEEEKAKRKAKSMAEDKVENRKIADRLLDIEVERLVEKGYVDIRSKLSILKPLVKAGLSLEEAYRGKFGELKAKEIKTKQEQLALLNKNKTNSKRVATTTGTTRTEDKAVLSKRDERIYKEMRKKDPGLTRKAYSGLMKDFDIED
jgi:hypothetical protein